MTDTPAVAALQTRFDDFQADVAHLAQQLTNIEADLRRQLAELAVDVASCRESVQRLERNLNSCAGSLDVLGRSLTAQAASWQETAAVLNDECQREAVHRDRVEAAFAERDAAQRNLSVLWQAGLEKAVSQIQDLERREDAFQQQLTSAGKCLQAAFQTHADASLAHLAGIGKQVSALRDCEEDYLDQAVESLRERAPQHVELAANLAAVSRSSTSLGEDLSRLARCQEVYADNLAKEQAASHNASGLQLLASGQPEAAEGCFRAAAEQWPGGFAPRYNLAVAVYCQGHLEEARSVACDLLSEFPDDPRMQLMNGILGLLAGNTNATMEAFEPCLDDDHPLLLCGLGLACHRAGWPTKARSYLSRLASHDHELAVAVRSLPPALWDASSGNRYPENASLTSSQKGP